jgi:hypothetical protein
MHWTLNPENGDRDPGGARGRSPMAADSRLKSCPVRVRIAPPVPMPVRLTGRTPRSGRGGRGSNPRRAACRRARLRPRSRTAGGPGRHRVAALGARTPTGREAGSRAQMLRVRPPPSARPPGRSPAAPCKRSPPRSALGEGSRWPLGELADPLGFLTREPPGSRPGLPAVPFAPVRTRPWYGWAARSDTGEGLHADVAQGRARPCHGRGPGFETRHPLSWRSRPIGRASALRPRAIWVRIPGALLMAL